EAYLGGAICHGRRGATGRIQEGQRLQITTANLEGNMNIFVGNMDWETTEDELEELFAPYGTVERVNILVERETRRPRGFGFVEMPNNTEAQAAIAGLNGTTLRGRPLTVTEARQREDRGGPRQPRW